MNYSETNGEYLAQNELQRNKWEIPRSKWITAKQMENISLKMNFSETNGEYLAQNELQRNKRRISRSKWITAKQMGNISLKTDFTKTGERILHSNESTTLEKLKIESFFPANELKGLN